LAARGVKESERLGSLVLGQIVPVGILSSDIVALRILRCIISHIGERPIRSIDFLNTGETIVIHIHTEPEESVAKYYYRWATPMGVGGVEEVMQLHFESKIVQVQIRS